MTTNNQPYTVVEAAKVLRVSKTNLYDRLNEGRVPELHAYRIGSSWRLPRRYVDAMAQGVAA